MGEAVYSCKGGFFTYKIWLSTAISSPIKDFLRNGCLFYVKFNPEESLSLSSESGSLTVK